MPNTFSEYYNEKIAKLEKENKYLKAQIEDFKGIKAEATNYKKIFEKFISKSKRYIFGQISRHDLKYVFIFQVMISPIIQPKLKYQVESNQILKSLVNLLPWDLLVS